nr:methyltransferase domain-containing protein [Ardenticatena sp.]
MSESNVQPPAVPPEKYTRDYFEQWCHGADEFRASSGSVLPKRLRIPLDRAHIQPGQHVLDIGCGRGEVALHCARHGAFVWSIDYAAAAIELAAEALARVEHDVRRRITLMQADARVLPFDDESFDVVFMLDVVEHLTPPELDQALREVKRVLRPQGMLIVHTMPNLWYYAVGYRLYRFVQRMRGVSLPADPRDRWPFKDVHVNEQTPLSLWRTLRRHGFETQVWLQTTQSYRYERNLVVRIGMEMLVRLPLLKSVFCNDIFARARKPGA